MFEPAPDMNERVGTGYTSLAEGDLSDNLRTMNNEDTHVKGDLSNMIQ